MSHIGQLIRDWRGTRRLSQLELALDAGISSRHLSFVETGRAKPSRDMILLLAETLSIPLRDRNSLLRAGGYAPEFQESGLGEPMLAPCRRALEFILEKQEPYPAVVVDTAFNPVMANRAMMRTSIWLLGARAGEASGNLLLSLFDEAGIKPFVVNWREVAGHTLRRIRHSAQIQGPGSAVRKLFDEIMTRPETPELLNAGLGPDSDTPLLRVDLEKDGTRLSLFSAIATFGTAYDITVSELLIETQFPADEASQRLLQSWAVAEV